MSGTSRIPAAIDALVATFTAAAPAGTIVLDGPGNTDSASQSIVFVGTNDISTDAQAQAATGSQRWPWLGHSQREETFDIHCTIWRSSGGANMKTARDGAFALLAILEAALVADPSLSGALLSSHGITAIDLSQQQDGEGAEAFLVFAVTCISRI